MALSLAEFQSLATAEIDSVYRFARSLTKQLAEADDLVQETYLRAIRGWEGFALRDHGIRAWLLRIAHNTHLNRVTSASVRRETRRQAVELDELVHSPTPVPEGPVDWSEFDGRLLSALEQLPDGLRSVLCLWALENLTYREVAEVLEVPIGTVMSRLHRARQVLQERLQSVALERGLVRE
jgi:RNA polymerase sigma-70 factor, ECF subfamily